MLLMWQLEVLTIRIYLLLMKGNITTTIPLGLMRIYHIFSSAENVCMNETKHWDWIHSFLDIIYNVALFGIIELANIA